MSDKYDRIEEIVDHYSNGQVSYSCVKAYIKKGYEEEYPCRIVQLNGECYIRLEAKKFHDNGQVDWMLTYDDKGAVLRTNLQYYRDGTVKIFDAAIRRPLNKDGTLA